MSDMVELDSIDLRILDAFQKNSRIGVEVLAEEAGLSPSAVTRRIARLRKTGVISEEVAILSADKLDIPLTVIVEITMAEKSQDSSKTFHQQIERLPEVTQCYFVTGDCDYVAIIRTRSVAEFDLFAREAFFDNPLVHRYTTRIVMNVIKSTHLVPIKP